LIRRRWLTDQTSSAYSTEIGGRVSTPDEEVTFSSKDQGATAARRAVALALVAALPDAGVEEAVEMLEQLLDYYMDMAQAPHAAPPPVLERQGVIASVEQSPDLVIYE
jgi:hypothetical protein